MQTLCEVKENEVKQISKIDGPNFAILRRLLELGFLPGQKIKVLKKSFSKKTILIELQNNCLALRCSVADYVRVE